MRYFLLAIATLSFSCLWAGNGNDGKSEGTTLLKEHKFSGVSSPIKFEPLDTVQDFLQKVTIKGEARMNAIYRSMSAQYADQTTPSKDLSFQDYPLIGTGGNGSAVPLLNLNIIAKPTPDFSVDLGYALAHTFAGGNDADGDTARQAVVRSNLNFAGKLNTSYGLFKIRAGGGVLWTSLSPMTISQNEFSNDGFDRLPWDWYTSSFQRYNAIYEGTAALGSEAFGSESFQGVDFQGSGLPGGFGFIAMYGRTARSVDIGKALDIFPSTVRAGRLDNSIGNAIIGLNYYGQIGDTTAGNVILNTIRTESIVGGDTIVTNTNELGRVSDNREIITADVRYNINGIEIYSEFGVGRVQNPKNSGDWKPGIMVSTNIPETIFGLPIKAKIYNIDHEMVSNVSTVMNSNSGAPNNGINQAEDFQTTVFLNALQEIGQVTNNRRGFSLTTGKKVGVFKFEFGYAFSQEIENIYNTITFQHRSNGFARSRFTPWLQTSGPYKRIKNGFRRTFEFIEITDVDPNYLKGFNQVEFTAKYKTIIARRSFIVKNLSNYSTVQDGFSPAPTFGDTPFLKAFYNQSLAFYELSKKVSLVAMFEFERNIANDRTELSLRNRKPTDQYSEGYGIGFDYDFSDFAGLYVRHRWMRHFDYNFEKDYFKGQQTSVELKVFF